MGGINMTRVLLGGLLAGLIVWILEGVNGIFYSAAMQAAMEAHGLSMGMSGSIVVLSLVVSFLGGIVAIWFYAACRPRLGAGPKTAVIVAVALWLGGYLLSLIGYHMLGLFPDSLLVHWGLTGLVEMVLGTLAGAWIYKE